MIENINPDKSRSIQEALAEYYRRVSEAEKSEYVNSDGLLHVDETALAHLHKAAKRLWRLNNQEV